MTKFTTQVSHANDGSAHGARRPWRAGMYLIMFSAFAPLAFAQTPCSQCNTDYFNCTNKAQNTYNQCQQSAYDEEQQCKNDAQSGWQSCFDECMNNNGGSNCAPSCNADVAAEQEGCTNAYNGQLSGCQTADSNSTNGCSSGYSACTNGPPACTN